MLFNRVPLYKQVVEQIYQLIDESKIQPGEPFPSERELVEKWGISRNVLREAFHVLEHRGLIVSRQGSGRFLRNPTLNISAANKENGSLESVSFNLEKCSLHDIYITRQLIEPKVVEEVARHRTSHQIKQIQKGYEYYSKIFRDTGDTIEEFSIHKLYTSNCGNYFLAQIVEFLYKITEDLMINRLQSIYNKHSVEESLTSHGLIIAAIKNKDTEAAGRAMYNHLQNTLEML